jgi:CDP-2,3-bis-(O-geranylgeranyl)-sn-glycerol synthase
MSSEELLTWIIQYYLTPMIANAMPVLVSGNTPIDGGRLFIDKKPLLGRNKTWEGFAIGLIGAYITASTTSVILDDPQIVAVATGAGVFALLGDIVGAFIKRRLNIPPGSPAPILDQLDFFAAATLYYYSLGVQEVTSRPLYVLITVLIVVLLHIVSNWLAYLAGLKTSRF